MAELQQISLGKLVNNTGQIAGVPKNPRQIRNEQYDKLLQSLKESDLTDYKPLMVYPQGGKFIVLGGNMRLRALRELKAETVSSVGLSRHGRRLLWRVCRKEAQNELG